MIHGSLSYVCLILAYTHWGTFGAWVNVLTALLMAISACHMAYELGRTGKPPHSWHGRTDLITSYINPPHRGVA